MADYLQDFITDTPTENKRIDCLICSGKADHISNNEYRCPNCDAVIKVRPWREIKNMFQWVDAGE